MAKLGQVGTNIHVSDLAYADYREMRGLLEAVGMRINTSKTKVMSALIPGEQCRAILLGGEPLEHVRKLKYLGSMFVADQGPALPRMGNHDQGRPGTALWTTSLRLRTMKKGQGESLW